MERNRQKPVGRDKGSLTEQQTKGTATTKIQKRGIHKKNPQNRTALLDKTATEPSRDASEFPLRHRPVTGTQRDGTWYGIPGSAWPGWGWVSPPGCAPSWILVKINPVLAKSRTSDLEGERRGQLAIPTAFLLH